jgi:hypothetical protein
MDRLAALACAARWNFLNCRANSCNSNASLALRYQVSLAERVHLESRCIDRLGLEIRTAR